MRNKGTDTDHLRAETLYEPNIFNEMFRCLSGASHHDARSRLIAYFLQPLQALQAGILPHFCRMQLAVMLFIVSFVTQQITIGPGTEEAFILLA